MAAGCRGLSLCGRSSRSIFPAGPGLSCRSPPGAAASIAPPTHDYVTDLYLRSRGPRAREAVGDDSQ